VLGAIRAAGVALVWVEHGVTSLAGFVDRLLALDRGRVVAVGRPDEVLADPEVQRTYLGDDAARMAGTGAETEAETEAATGTETEAGAEAKLEPPGEVTS
jgi:ABC-type glutathione transport system ATPase component